MDHTQTLSRNHVVVTGAGFTRAFVPGAPLLVDDFNNDGLEAKVRGLPNASRLLDWERSLDERGRIDIERLMTRLDALMPYDHAESAGNAANEYGFLLSRGPTYTAASFVQQERWVRPYLDKRWCCPLGTTLGRPPLRVPKHSFNHFFRDTW